MSEVFSKIASMFLVVCVLLISACTGYRARNLIAETQRCIKEAEDYDAHLYAPDYIERARGNIKSARRMLQMRREDIALRSAVAAHSEASEALRLSLSSKSARALKSATDALKVVDINQAGDENPSVYRQLISEVKSAQRAFVASDHKKCIRFSTDAVFHANILLEPLKKECDILKKRVTQKLRHLEKAHKNISDIRAMVRQAEKLTKDKQYLRAIKKWKRIEARLKKNT